MKEVIFTMVSKLVNGDYSLENGQPLTVDYLEELLQNAFVAVNTRRRRFYPNKSFGSYIKETAALPLEEYAFAFASQATDGIDGVYVKSAERVSGGVKIKLLLNDTEGEVVIALEDNV